jgi:hypothetical protein
MARVTRLGDFSPIGQLFTLGCLLNITEVALSLGNFFSRGNTYALIGWATFWAIFSQTHLVTLLMAELWR